MFGKPNKCQYLSAFPEHPLCFLNLCFFCVANKLQTNLYLLKFIF